MKCLFFPDNEQEINQEDEKTSIRCDLLISNTKIVQGMAIITVYTIMMLSAAKVLSWHASDVK